eukprot:jgi/Botrbrau1/12197/Bobra.0186s0102.1
MRGNEFLAVLNSHGGAVRKWVSVVSRREWTTPGWLPGSRALKGWGVAQQEVWLCPPENDGRGLGGCPALLWVRRSRVPADIEEFEQCAITSIFGSVDVYS